MFYQTVVFLSVVKLSGLTGEEGRLFVGMELPDICGRVTGAEQALVNHGESTAISRLRSSFSATCCPDQNRIV